VGELCSVSMICTIIPLLGIGCCVLPARPLTVSDGAGTLWKGVFSMPVHKPATDEVCQTACGISTAQSVPQARVGQRDDGE
jgi:hypothetical protein